MNYLRQVRRGLDFIESHLDEEFGTASVARHAGASHWHFQRLFKALTNETLKGYIRSRRLARALVALHGRRSPILQVAVDSGFGSQAAFTRAFRQAFGTTPGKYRALGMRMQFVPRLLVDEKYLRHLHRGVSLEPTMVRRPQMRLVGLRTSFYGVESDKGNMGEKLPPLWEAFLSRAEEVVGAGSEYLYGVVMPVPGRERLDYLAAALVTDTVAVPQGMVSVTIPAATYAQFTHRGLPQDLNQTVSYVYAGWLCAAKVQHTYGPDLEIYGADYIPGSAESVIRYAIPVVASKPGSVKPSSVHRDLG